MATSETKISLKNYDIQDVVWISIALLSMEKYESCACKGSMQYHFDEDEIIKKAKKLVGSKIEIETIRECSRNQKKYEYQYETNRDGSRKLYLRIRFPMEQGEDTVPQNLKLSDLVLKNKKYITLGELITFIQEQYPAIIMNKEVPKPNAISNKKTKRDNINDSNEKRESEATMVNTIDFSKNTILYGPPGTGKTYNSAIYAVAICDERSLESMQEMAYQDVMKRYKELVAAGRIAFTTFHQSYGYEEFIEGIKPVIGEQSDGIGYTIEDGVFKSFCERAKIPSNININPNASIWFMRLDSDNAKVIKDECFKDNSLIINIEKEDAWSKERFVDMMQIGDYVISYAGNSIYIDAIGIIEGEAIEDSSKNTYQWSRKVKWTKFVDKVDVKSINSGRYLPNFSIAKMNHMKLSDLLHLLPNENVTEVKPYVFIVDEINRGNISKIFGELITLIEDTKRAGMDEEAVAILPYSGQAFSVPSNVYILGTMNTADRSIAIMDTALRRRFQFVEMMPDADVLREIGADKVAGLDIAAILEKINERITFLYDREHTIGHAFFTKLAIDPSITTLASIFEKSVIPLLQEYFYEDYQKIQLVLGDNGKRNDAYKFILDVEVRARDIFKGSVEEVVDLPEQKYIVNREAFLDINSYKEII